MMERLFCIGNIILIGVIVFVLLAIFVNLFYGVTLMIRLKKIENKWKEYRTVLDNEYFEKWIYFLKEYNVLISRMQRLCKFISENEKKYYKYFKKKKEYYERAITMIKEARDVKETRWFRNKSIKKSLKTKRHNIVFDTNPQRRNQLLENVSYGYCNKEEGRQICYGLIHGIVLGIVGFIIIDSIVRIGVVNAFFWKYWLLVILLAIGLFVCLALNIEIGLGDFLGIAFIAPIIISMTRTLVMNITIYICDFRRILNVFWIVLALAYICLKFLLHITKCNSKLKIECDNRLCDMEDLKKEEKVDNYRDAFGENGCIEIYLDNVELNISHLEELVLDFQNEKNKESKGQIFSEIYPDFKILEKFVLTRSIQDDYYNSFERIMENNRIFERI